MFAETRERMLFPFTKVINRSMVEGWRTSIGRYGCSTLSLPRSVILFS